MPYICHGMKRLVTILTLAGLYGLYGQCANCTVSGSPILPRGFDPASITLEVGRDTEVVVQFTLPDTVIQYISFFNSNYTLYPNYAIYVDSLRMAGGSYYVVVRGTNSDPVTYGNGALAFDQAPRYKQVGSQNNNPIYANVVVYRNPSPSEAGVSQGQLSPPRGCVRACLRGVNPTPTGEGDSLYIFLRAFIANNSFSGLPPTSTDANQKDTTDLMPSYFGNPLYSDVALYYGPIFVRSVAGAIESAVRGGVQVSPNPAWGVAEVRFTTNYPVPVVARAIDMSGRVVGEQDLGVMLPGEHAAELRLPAGIYLIELLAGKERHKARLIVLGE